MSLIGSLVREDTDMALSSSVWFAGSRLFQRSEVLPTSMRKQNKERMRRKLAAASFVPAARLVNSDGKVIKRVFCK